MTGAEIALVVCRFLFDAAALFLWGAGAYVATLVPAGLREEIWSGLRRARQAALAALVAVGVFYLPLRTVIISDSWGAAFDGELLSAVALETNIGTAWIVQAVGIGLLLLATALLSGAHRIAATAALSALLLASLSLSGHAAMNEGWIGRLHQANNVLHLLAAGAWIGALPAVLLVLPRLGDLAGEQATVALVRFSTAGHVAVMLVVLSGLANTLLILGQLPIDFASQYQRLLLIKIGLVAIMIAAAIVNRYIVIPRVSRWAGAKSAIELGTTAEIVLSGAVLGLVASFGMTEPGG